MSSVPFLNKVHPGDKILVMIGIKTLDKPKLRNLFAVDHHTHTIDAAARMLRTQVKFLRPSYHRTYPSVRKEVPVIVIDKAIAIPGHPFDRAGQLLGQPDI